MLQSATVHPATLAVLKAIMQEEAFRQFTLVGGTSLALQLGHRISIDLDFFTHEAYNAATLINALDVIGRLDILVDNPPFLQVRLDDIKIDFLKFPYAFVSDYVEIEGIRLAPVESIAVMKMLAIARRGSKKDFIDLFFILEKYSLPDLIGVFEEKIPNVDLFHILKSLTYFEDAESDGNPKMLKKVTWQTIKKVLAEKVKSYMQE